MATIPSPAGPEVARVAIAFGELVRGLRALHQASPDCRRAWFDLDLTMAQFRALMIIAESGGSSGRQLAERLGIGPSAVTPLVDRLVQHGYVRREPAAEDRRITWVRPTERGLELFQAAHAANRESFEQALATLELGELAIVDRAIAVLRSAIDRRLQSSAGQAVPVQPPEEQ